MKKENKVNIFKGIELDTKPRTISDKDITEYIKRTVLKIAGVNLSEAHAFLDSLIKNIVNQTSIYYDSDRKKVLGVYGDDIVEITQEFLDAGLEGFKKLLRKFDEEKINVFSDGESVEQMLEKLLRVNLVGVEHEKIMEFNKDVVSVLISARDNSIEDSIGVNEGIVSFLNVARTIIEDRSSKVNSNRFPIRNGKYKSYLTNLFIAELVEYGLIYYDQLKEMGIIEAMSDEEFEHIYLGRNRSLFSSYELKDALLLRGICKDDKEATLYLYKNYRKLLLDSLTEEDGLRLVVNDIANDKEKESIMRNFKYGHIQQMYPDALAILLTRRLPENYTCFLSPKSKTNSETTIKRDFMLGLSRKQLMAIYSSDAIMYRPTLTPDDLIDMYRVGSDDELEEGQDEFEKGLKFRDYILLHSRKAIRSTDVIKLKKFSNLYEDEEERFNFLCNIVSFYDAELLEEMLENGELNGRFVEELNEILNSEEFSEEKRAYSEFIQSRLEFVKDPEKLYMGLVKAGVDINLNVPISFEKFSDSVFSGELGFEDIVLLYNKGLIQNSMIQPLFTDNDIIRFYRELGADCRILNALSDRATNLAILIDGNDISVQELITLYSAPEGLDIEELKGIAEIKSFEDVDVAELLPDDISLEKVEELAKNWFISHDDLSILVERGIITQEKADELGETIMTHETYKELFGKLSGVIILRQSSEGTGEPTTSGLPSGNTDPRKKQIKNDPVLQEKLFSQLGFDNMGNIVLQGSRNSLNGYTIFSSEELGIVVLMNNSKPGNATYVMSIQQAGYVLMNLGRTEKANLERIRRGEKDVLVSDATKSTIRQISKEQGETEHIKIKNASRNWGENIVDAMRKVSKPAREKLKKGSEQRREIESLLEEIRQDYDQRRD